jgi:hypothetical protein
MNTRVDLFWNSARQFIFKVLAVLILGLQTSPVLADKDKNALTEYGQDIPEGAVEKLVNRVQVKDSYATYALGLLPDAETARTCGVKVPADLDWEVHAVVAVVLKENAYALHFKEWRKPKDGVGELVVEFYGQEVLAAGFPAQFYRVEKKSLKKVVVRLQGADKPLGEIDLTIKPAPATYVRRGIVTQGRGKLIIHPSDKPVITLDDGELVNKFLKVGDKEYPLAFDKNGNMWDSAARSNSARTAVVSGRLETKRGGSKEYEVIVVSDLSFEPDAYLRTKSSVEVKGEVTFEDLGKTKGPAFSGLYGTVSAEGKTYYLTSNSDPTGPRFQKPKDFDELAKKFNGKTIIVTGEPVTHSDQKVKGEVVYIAVVKSPDGK